jgi:hypothetical protein
MTRPDPGELDCEKEAPRGGGNESFPAILGVDD